MKQLNIFFIGLLLSNSFVYSQVTSLNKTLIPPSPSSAVYKKYDGYTPSLVTGSVNIPIPLYELRHRDVVIPFVLNYQTSGIKVYDDPYPCGYGWVFSPGLRITRTIMGRPDEQYNWKTSNDGTLSDYNFFRNSLLDDNTGMPNQSLLDTQHDIFNVYLAQENHTFILNRKNNIFEVITRGHNLKIKVYENPMRFEVIDANGIKYYFDNNYTESISNPRYITAWMLTKIVLINGEEISFYWNKARHTPSTGYQFGPHSLKDSQDIMNGGGPPEYSSSSDVGNLEIYGRYDEMQHLSHVTFPGGNIKFEYKSNEPLMTKMLVNNLNNETIKTVDFVYGTISKESWLLKNLKISDEGTYSFIYNNYHFADKYAQDYWGYYNGKTGNRSLIPLIKLKTYNSLANPNDYSYRVYGDADRKINAEYMKANMLVQINYPTGGYTSFEYEPHKFVGKIPATTEIDTEYNRPLNEGGGLRVTKVSTRTDLNSTPVVKTYTYGKQENGLGISMREPTLDTFLEIYQSFDCYAEQTFPDVTNIKCFSYRQVFINPTSNYMSYNLNTLPIWYEEVTEHTNEGKTIFNFGKLINDNEISYQFGSQSIIYYNTLFSKGPVLLKTIVFKKNGSSQNPVKETKNNYNIADREADLNLFVKRKIINQLSCNSHSAPDFYITRAGYVYYPCSGKGEVQYPINIMNMYESNQYFIGFRYEYLSETEIINYTTNGNIIENIKYEYANHLLREKTIKNSDETIEKESYLYPFDYNQITVDNQKPVLEKMSQLNIISTPFRLTYERNGAKKNKEIWFKDMGNNLIIPEREFIQNDNGAKECRKIYEYDLKGNIQTIIYDENLKETYLWGYNWLYPVMKIEGINYNDVKNLVGEATLRSLNENINNTEFICNNIRSKVDKQALVSSYTYIPLIGIASFTDPRKITISYKYDRKGRLNETSDYNRNAIQRFAYNNREEEEVFSASFNTESSYEPGAYLSTKCIITGGTGWYNYTWTLKNSSGKILHSSSSTKSDISISLPESGAMTLTCEVEDALTSRKTSFTRTFNVKTKYITFQNIIGQGTPKVSAHIICFSEVEITFKLDCSLSGSGMCKIAGNEYIIEDSPSTRFITLKLPAGDHLVNLTINEGSSGDIIFGITKVSGKNGEEGGGYINAYS